MVSTTPDLAPRAVCRAAQCCLTLPLVTRDGYQSGDQPLLRLYEARGRSTALPPVFTDRGQRPLGEADMDSSFLFKSGWQ